MLSGEGLGVWRDDGDQLFSISIEKWMGRNGLSHHMRDSRRRFQPDPAERFLLEQIVGVRRVRVQGVATGLGLQKA